MLAAAGGLLCMAILFLWRRPHRTKGLVLLILFVITTVYALQIGVEYPLGRFQFFWRSFEERSQLAEKTMAMFSDYRLAGVGVGNFQYAYPKYQPAERKDEFVRHAHNDWAQFLAEAGILGLGVLLAAVGIYLFRTLRLWKKRSDPFAVCLGIAPLAVMAAMAIHAVSDFNLHVPANFLMLTAVMAVGYSALHLERHRGGDKVFLRYHVLPLRYRGLVVLFVVLGFMGWSGVWAVRHFVAEAYCNTVHNSTLNRDQNPPLEEIEKAIAWDPANAGYWYRLAGERARVGGRDGQPTNWRRCQLEIVAALEQAARLNPFNAEYHLRLAWEYSRLWDDSDQCERWQAAADLSAQRAAYFAGEKNPLHHLNIANYWVKRTKTMAPGDPEWKAAWDRASWHFKKHEALEKG